MTAKHFLMFASQPYALPIMQPLQKAIEVAGHKVKWFVTDPLIPTDASISRLTTLADVKAFHPVAVFSASNWVPLPFPGLKVQLFHGFNVEKRDANKGHFRIRGMFDLYCTQGPNTTGPFRELAQKHGYFKVAETGWSKMDPLFQPLPAVDEIRFAHPQRPVILFASTFTESLSAAPHLLAAFRKLIKKPRYNWLFTLHPKMSPNVVKDYRALESDNARFLDSTHTIALLKTADLMVCDTSSIILEFLLQDKPVVTFRTRKPASYLLNFTDVDELEAMIEQGLSHPDGLMQAIRIKNAETHPYHNGHSGARILDAVLGFDSLQPALRKRRPRQPMRYLDHYLKLRKFS